MILYNFIRYLYLSIKYHLIVKQVCKDENLLPSLSKLLGVEFREDWIGRMYAVFNPHVKDGKYNPDSEVYELGSDEKSYAFVENHIMGNLNIVSKVIQAKNLFDIIAYKLEKIDDYHNFLFIMYPVPYVECKKWTKRFFMVYGLIAIAVILFCLL